MVPVRRKPLSLIGFDPRRQPVLRRKLVPFYETADFRPTTQVVLHRL
jgi:hypothetical protein